MSELAEFVWHYTKIGTLEKIFPPKESIEYKEGKIKLRFTNIRFLNDPSEGLVLKTFFEKHRKEIANKLPENSPKNLKEIILNEPITEDMMNLNTKYIFSTTSLADSFAFWSKEYAGLEGIAIGFNLFDLEELEDGFLILRTIEYISFHEQEEDLIKSIAGSMPYYNYSIAELLGIKDSNSNSNSNSSSSSRSMSSKEILSYTIDGLFCIYKQKSWEHEKETRIIIDKASDSEIKFEGNKVGKYRYEYIDASYVKGIMLGPKCNEDQVKAVREYLEKNGYKDILVGRSRAFELR